MLFEWSNNAGAISMKMDGSALEEKYSFKMLRLSFSSKFECSSYIITNVAKTSSKKTATSKSL